MADSGDDVTAERCEKCGSDYVNTLHEGANRSRWIHRCQDTPDEHLHHTCRRCGWEWCTPTLDTLERVKSIELNLEHVGWRYRRDVQHDGEKRWRFTDNEMEVEALAEKGWQVERLYRATKRERKE